MNFKIVFFVIGAIFSSEAAPDLKICSRKDIACVTKNSNALFQVAMKGDASLNIDSLEPMHVDLIDGKLATLSYKLSDSTAVGFSNCVLEDVRFAEDDTEIGFKLNCPLVHMTGQYEAKGELLALAVEGKGDFKLETREYITDIVSAVEKTKADDGKEYFAIKNFKIDGALKGGSVELSNLFNGQKDLSDLFHKFANDNFPLVAKEVQGPAFKVIVKKVIKNLNKVFKAVSIDQMLTKE